MRFQIGFVIQDETVFRFTIIQYNATCFRLGRINPVITIKNSKKIKRKLITIVLVVFVSTTMFSQVFTGFSVKGSIVEIRQKNTIGKIETIVDEKVDIKNLDLKFGLNSGTTMSDSTPVSKDFTKPQFIKLNNPSEGNKTWLLVINQLKGAVLPFDLSFSRSNPLDINTPNPKAWAGYGIDYKRTEELYFGDEGAAFYVAFNTGAKELTYKLSLLSSDVLGGEFAVVCSSDFKKWSTLANYSSSKSITQNNTFTHALKPDVRYVRWVYSVRNKQSVTLNNISIK